MVKIMENPMNKWLIWGENPLFLETPILIYLEPISPLFFLQKKVKLPIKSNGHLGYRYVYMSQAYLFRTYYLALDRFQ